MRQSEKIKNVAIALKLAGASGRDLLYGISTYAREHEHWRLHIFSRAEDFTPAALKELPELDGIITSERGSGGMTSLLERTTVPLVVIGIKGEWLTRRTRNIVYVRNDDEDIGRFAAAHLLTLGRFRAFGFVPSRQRTYWSLLREKGFRAALRTRGLAVSVAPTSEKSLRKTPRTSALSDWLRRLPKPAAIMAAFDERAVEVLDACNAAGISVPGQIAILGVDNDELLCDFTTPPLTSVLPDHVREGARAAQELERLLRTRKPAPVTTVLCRDKRIIRRESTAPVTPATHLVDEALRFIRRQAKTDLRVDDVVRHLGVSRRLADLRFHEAGEKSIAGVIREIRLNEVARRLRESDAPIGQIAAACSFANVQHLANAFRRHFKKSMTDYRRDGMSGTRPSGRTRSSTGIAL